MSERKTKRQEENLNTSRIPGNLIKKIPIESKITLRPLYNIIFLEFDILFQDFCEYKVKLLIKILLTN